MKYIYLIMLSTVLNYTCNVYAITTGIDEEYFNVPLNQSIKKEPIDKNFATSLDVSQRYKLQQLLIERGYQVLMSLYLKLDMVEYKNSYDLFALIKLYDEDFDMTSGQDLQLVNISSIMWALYDMASEDSKNKILSPEDYLTVFKRGSFSLKDKDETLFDFLINFYEEMNSENNNTRYRGSSIAYKRRSSHYKKERTTEHQYGIDLKKQKNNALFKLLPFNYEHILFSQVNCPDGTLKLFIKCEEHGLGSVVEAAKHLITFINAESGSTSPADDYRREKDISKNIHKAIFYALSKLTADERINSIKLNELFQEYTTLIKNEAERINVYAIGLSAIDVEKIIDNADNNKLKSIKFTFNEVALNFQNYSEALNALREYGYDDIDIRFRHGNECVLDIEEQIKAHQDYIFIERDYSKKSEECFIEKVSSVNEGLEVDTEETYQQSNDAPYSLNVSSPIWTLFGLENLDIETYSNFSQIIKKSIDPYEILNLNPLFICMTVKDCTFVEDVSGTEEQIEKRRENMLRQSLYLQELLKTDNLFFAKIKESLHSLKEILENEDIKKIKDSLKRKKEVKSRYYEKVTEIFNYGNMPEGNENKEEIFEKYMNDYFADKLENLKDKFNIKDYNKDYMGVYYAQKTFFKEALISLGYKCDLITLMNFSFLEKAGDNKKNFSPSEMRNPGIRLKNANETGFSIMTWFYSLFSKETSLN